MQIVFSISTSKNTLFISMSTSPVYLFFDTETTGIPRDYQASCTDTDNWPRLVQLGWILTDAQGNTLNEGNRIVRPEGFIIPTQASDVHGITTERALAEGLEFREVMLEFYQDLYRCTQLVGHNIHFDLKVMGAEYYRLGYDYRCMIARPSTCTMQATIEFCNIPGHYGPKWPRLQELYVKLFGREFEGAHDAMADIRATRECFFELQRLGIL